jgi:hypothetical protein
MAVHDREFESDFDNEVKKMLGRKMRSKAATSF